MIRGSGIGLQVFVRTEERTVLRTGVPGGPGKDVRVTGRKSAVKNLEGKGR